MTIKTVTVDGTTYDINDARINFTSGATTSFLRQDGNWTTVDATDTKVQQTAYTGTANVAYPLLLSPQSGRENWVDGIRESSVDPYVTVNPLNSRVFICPTGLTTTYPGYNLYDTSNSKYYGTFSIETLWTSASTPGIGRLTLGNGTATDTDGGVIGQLDIYGSSAYYNRIVSAAASSAKVNTIPNANGYLAVGATTGVGSTTKGVYLNSSGVLTACSYTLGQDVSSSAKLTDTYPSGLTWTAGTTAGPVPNISRAGSTTTAVAGSAIPSASASASGIVTTGAQTIAGNKTFSGASTFSGQATFSATTTLNGRINLNNILIGKSGTTTTGNYTTTLPSTGTTGQIMFVLMS